MGEAASGDGPLFHLKSREHLELEPEMFDGYLVVHADVAQGTVYITTNDALHYDKGPVSLRLLIIPKSYGATIRPDFGDASPTSRVRLLV